MRNRGGDLKLLNLAPKVRDLMFVTKLYTIFQMFEEEAAAVASFSAAQNA